MLRVTVGSIRIILGIFALLLGSYCSRASLSYTPWMPLYKGIDHAIGSNCPSTVVTNNGVVFTDSAVQVVHCLRVDLTDPDVQLFTRPRAPGYVAESRETLSLSISNYIRNYKVQVASDANFYSPNDPTAEGLPTEVHGFLVCTGQVVSAVDSQNRYASLLFTSNKEPSFNLNNRPGAPALTNVYTAVTGFYPLLTNGMNVWALYYNDLVNQYPDSTIHNYQPRTAFGISQDHRYLFMMTIDGRQNGDGGGTCGFDYSRGALDAETAMWLLLFGSWNAISMDGGGSTALYMADCAGEPVALNHSNLLQGRNAERLIGAHFGVYAKPLPNPINTIVVTPADTTATLTFQTWGPATTWVDYGLTPSYGTYVSYTNALTNHVATLNGLIPGRTYYYRITCGFSGGTIISSDCRLFTINPGNAAPRTLLFDVTKSWKYYSNNLDGVNWQTPEYNDASWYGPSPGLLYIDNSTSTIAPKGTQMAGYNQVAATPVSPTHYFRTHFSFPVNPVGAVLYLTNYLDDAAVFYLNGIEIQRIRVSLPPTNINYASITYPPSTTHCGSANDATCADVFSIQGSAGNLVAGDNVLAVEVHQATVGNVDVAFGSALAYSFSQVQAPTLNVFREGDITTLYWNGSGFILQEAADPAGQWNDVPGPVTASTYDVNVFDGIKFYRLRN